MPNNVIRQDYGSLGNDVQTQMLIAPVLAKMVSDRAYAVGEQFIVNNVLYKITQAVSAADVPLVVGSNCEVSDSITQQMKNKGNTIVAQATTTVTQGQIYVQFTFNMPQGANSILAIVPIYYNVTSSFNGMTGVICYGADVNNRTVNIKIFGTTVAQDITCTALIIYK